MDCCGGDDEVKRLTPVRRAVGGAVGVAKWAAPIAGLAIVPKCPACLAGYVLVATGLGMSFTTASVVRWGTIAVCGVGLGYLVVRVGWRWCKSVRVRST